MYEEKLKGTFYILNVQQQLQFLKNDSFGELTTTLVKHITYFERKFIKFNISRFIMPSIGSGLFYLTLYFTINSLKNKTLISYLSH